MSVEQTIERIEAMDDHTPLRGWDGHTAVESGDLQALVTQYKRLETALQHYADGKNWATASHYNDLDWWVNEDNPDGPSIAKEALKERG